MLFHVWKGKWYTLQRLQPQMPHLIKKNLHLLNGLNNVFIFINIKFCCCQNNKVLMLISNFFMMLLIFAFQNTHESLIFIPSRKDCFKIKRKSNSIFTLKRNLDPAEHKAISWKVIILQLLNGKCPCSGFCGNFWRIYPLIKYADACVFLLSCNTVTIIPLFKFN